MPDLPPPQYEPRPCLPPLNVMPLEDQASFQVGRLGLEPSSICGIVQAKETDRITALFLSLTGDEWNKHSKKSINIFEKSVSLYEKTATSVCASTHLFNFMLPNDLPQCIHLSDSGLTYALNLHVTLDNGSTSVVSVPVHLTRYSSYGLSVWPHGAQVLDFSPIVTPQVLSISDPLSVTATLPSGVFTVNDPIPVVVRIQIPSIDFVSSRRERLRTVTAELIRDIYLSDGDSDVLSHVVSTTGTLARFSPTRPIVTRLILHPNLRLCESISQSSALHRISFRIRVRIGLISLNEAARHDALLVKTVLIVPDPIQYTALVEDQEEVPAYEDTPPPETTLDSKNGVAVITPPPSDCATSPPSENASAEDRIPSYWESESTSRHSTLPLPIANDEFDGYDDLAAPLSPPTPPPRIEDNETAAQSTRTIPFDESALIEAVSQSDTARDVSYARDACLPRDICTGPSPVFAPVDIAPNIHSQNHEPPPYYPDVDMHSDLTVSANFEPPPYHG